MHLSLSVWMVQYAQVLIWITKPDLKVIETEGE
jgi:hypothetical protein